MKSAKTLATVRKAMTGVHISKKTFVWVVVGNPSRGSSGLGAYVAGTYAKEATATKIVKELSEGNMHYWFHKARQEVK